MIERTRSPEALRGYEARITPASRRALRSANRQHLADVRELFLSQLSPEQLEAPARAWRDIDAVDFDTVLPTRAFAS